MTVTTEDLAVHAAVWGPRPELADAIENRHLSADLFVDPIRGATVEAVLGLVADSHQVDAPAVCRRLMDGGTPEYDAVQAVVLPGVFEAAGCRTGGLGHYVHRLHEAAERRRIMDQLVTMANTLEHPGDPARVAARLEKGTAA
ncbi:hypothetical protein BH23ACT2_BH23ACT2_20820 [soil metagenome]